MTWRNRIVENATDKIMAEKVVDAIDKLFSRDQILFGVDANERSITHRLGIYLQENFPDWDVDCEYNREGHSVKYLTDKIGKAAADDIRGKTIFPDIIIHKRGAQNNKLVIEVKKTNNEQSNDIDLKKLEGLSKQLNYKNALFLRLKTLENGIGVDEFRWVKP